MKTLLVLLTVVLISACGKEGEVPSSAPAESVKKICNSDSIFEEYDPSLPYCWDVR